MSSRFIDWLTNLTAKSTTIDGSEITHIGSSGLSQKATVKDILSYGRGATTPSEDRLGDSTTFAKVFRTLDGAIYLEKGPYTGGQVQGNARGAGAFDWQATRNAATQVASGGAGSVAIGAYNTASGGPSTAIGFSCSASAQYSIVISTNSQVSAQYATVIGGWRCAATNKAQFATGYAPASGQSQANIQPFYTATTDASATVLNITNTDADRMVIPPMRACAITGLVTAMSDATDGYKVKAWEIKCVITRDNSNNTRIVGTQIITELGADTEAASWAITSITADDTNESLAITVTGEASTNIRWQASLFYGQVGY